MPTPNPVSNLKRTGSYILYVSIPSSAAQHGTAEPFPSLVHLPFVMLLLLLYGGPYVFLKPSGILLSAIRFFRMLGRIW